MKTLYLHIGAHRTATSSIQAFLFKNAAALAERGYLYPYGVKRHDNLFRSLFSGLGSVGGIVRDIEREAQDSAQDLHSVILSDEDICQQRDLSVLEELTRHFHVRVIFALRRQDVWLESWYLQNIKWQWRPELSHITLDEFLARRENFHWIDYDRYVRHLEEIFGPENLLLPVFETAQMPEGPVHAFRECVGLTDISGLKNAPHVNSSRSPLVSEFMRCLPLDEAPPSYRAILVAACNRLDKRIRRKNGGDSGLLIDHETRASILEEYRGGNETLARRRFARTELFLEPLPGPEEPLAKLELPESSHALMDELVAPFLRELIAQEKKRAAIPTGPEIVRPQAMRDLIKRYLPLGRGRN